MNDNPSKGNFNKSLEGKCALITGAAGGIARATAIEFSARGASLVLTDVNTNALCSLVDATGSAQVLLQEADLTKASDVRQLIACSVEQFGRVDVFVNCAGGYHAYSTFDEIEEDDWDRVVDLNLKSVFLCCKAVVPVMKSNGWGRIINLGSLAGRSTSAGSSPAHYATAKAGVSILTQYVAKEVAPYGITANTVAPGTTLTERVRSVLTPEKELQFVERTPVGRLATPDDIVGVISFLASEESRYITGATIDVNGGRLMLI